ncbi:glycoside hydrolase [Candidatus Poribacteria bacterium]|nr:glycoside hydrolase [Candidatus Poribacteria bacterium]
MKTIRVLHIITGLAVGGAEMMLYKLLSNMDLDKFKSVVISLKSAGKIGTRISNLGIKVESLKMNGQLPSLASMSKLSRITWQFKPDLVQGWMYHGNLAAQFASMLSMHKVPTLWNIRRTPYHLKKEKILRAGLIRLSGYLSKLPDITLYNSKVSAQLHNKIGYDTNKSLVIPNGFDTEVFMPSDFAKSDVRSELGLSHNTILIGLVARYDPMKDHKNFLLAASHLLRSHPGVHFLLVGRNVNQKNQDLVEWISKLRIGKNIHLLGERTDIPRLTASLNLACLSSYGEGFPNAIGEAMSCGVPCVVTSVGDMPYIVGNTGKIVPPKEPIKLANELANLLSLPNQMLRDLGAKARKRIEQNFSLDHITESYSDLYEKMTIGKGKRP